MVLKTIQKVAAAGGTTVKIRRLEKCIRVPIKKISTATLKTAVSVARTVGKSARTVFSTSTKIMLDNQTPKM